MSSLITQPAQAICLPAPRVAISIRPGVMEDFAFIDRLQTAYCKQLGYMPRAQMESKIRAGHVLVAEGSGSLDVPLAACPPVRAAVDRDTGGQAASGTAGEIRPLGFVMGTDRYFKRDDCGIIYQLCVEEGVRRGLIGAMLVKAMFDRAAYGCRLFCCWCAQDIEANKFWESLGFVPLAYRAGSEKKGRVHIFWQKRIRAGDEATPWWFPSQTTGGSIRQDRLVLPIPPGTHWSDAKPIILPSTPVEPADPAPRRALPGTTTRKPVVTKRPPAVRVLRGFFFAPPETPAEKPAEKTPRPPKQRVKNDPVYIAAARELRDRWLERVADEPDLLLPAGKYDVARALPEAGPLPHGRGALPEIEIKALPEAA